MSRVDELAAGLAAVERRLAAACAAAGRPRADVTLIAVTKTWPATDVVLLADLGLRDFGENRDQEASGKAAEVAALRPELELRWHFVGQLQRNKARSVVGYAAMVHSVDRPELADALSAAAVRAARVVDALVQVHLDEDPHRGGVAPADAPGLADHIAGLDGLRLRGVMAVAPLGADPGPAFERLAAVAGVVRAAHPGADVISAGMSADLEAAIEKGATHVRVGTALLGGRRPFSR